MNTSAVTTDGFFSGHDQGLRPIEIGKIVGVVRVQGKVTGLYNVKSKSSAIYNAIPFMPSQADLSTGSGIVRFPDMDEYVVIASDPTGLKFILSSYAPPSSDSAVDGQLPGIASRFMVGDDYLEPRDILIRGPGGSHLYMGPTGDASLATSPSTLAFGSTEYDNRIQSQNYVSVSPLDGVTLSTTKTYFLTSACGYERWGPSETIPTPGVTPCAFEQRIESAFASHFAGVTVSAGGLYPIPTGPLQTIYQVNANNTGFLQMTPGGDIRLASSVTTGDTLSQAGADAAVLAAPSRVELNQVACAVKAPVIALDGDVLNLNQESSGSTFVAGAAFSVSSGLVEIHSSASIRLVVGSSSITITPSGVTITGPTVSLNP